MRGAVPEMDYRRTHRWRGRSICQPGTPSAGLAFRGLQRPFFCHLQQGALALLAVGVMRCHTPLSTR